MKEKATIYDYARMCERIGNCTICPLSIQNNKKEKFCDELLRECPDEANELILKWCEEHHIETRQDRFLKMFPNAKPLLYICPSAMGYKVECPNDCDKCRRDYWLAEVDENDI